MDEPLEALGPVVPVGGARDDELPGAAGGHEGEADALLGPALLGVELCAEVVYLFEVDLALLALAVLVGVVGECEGVVNSVAEPTLLPVTVDTALLYHKALYNKLLHKLYEKGKIIILIVLSKKLIVSYIVCKKVNRLFRICWKKN